MNIIIRIRFNYFLGLSIPFLLITILLSIYNIENENRLPARNGQNWLLLFAHPDDETMFFAPTIFSLTSMKVKPYLISVTAGNSEGLGATRIKELYAAASVYGIGDDQIRILDPKEQFYSDGFNKWDIKNFSIFLHKEIGKINPAGVITFDEFGISKHPNHVSCYLAIKLLKTQKMLNENVTISLALKSVPLLRKYLGLFDVIYTKFMETESTNYYAIWNFPLRVHEAMARHSSQMRWFRHLYMAFSRYVYINTFMEIT